MTRLTLKKTSADKNPEWYRAVTAINEAAADNGEVPPFLNAKWEKVGEFEYERYEEMTVKFFTHLDKVEIIPLTERAERLLINYTEKD